MGDRPPVGVIVNPKADGGRAIRLLPRLAADLAGTGHCARIHVTTRPGDAVDAAREFAQEGLELVIAVGGDGTVNEVANGLLGQDSTRLGIVAAGRGTDLVRTLALPGQRSPDIAALCAATPRRIDLGLATFGHGGSRAFVNVAGVGFDAEVARRAARSRLPGTHAAYLSGLATALAGYRNQEMSVDIDSQVTTGTMRAVLVANGRYFGGGFHIVPDAELEDGLLDVALIGDIGRLDLVRTVPSIYRGEHTTHPCFQQRPGRNVRVETAVPARVELDGEVAGWAPVTFTVLPGALQVAL